MLIFQNVNGTQLKLKWAPLTKALANRKVSSAQLVLTGEIMSGAQLSAHLPECERRSTPGQKVWAALRAPLKLAPLTKALANKKVNSAQLALTSEIMSGAQLSAHFPERERRSERRSNERRSLKLW